MLFIYVGHKKQAETFMKICFKLTIMSEQNNPLCLEIVFLCITGNMTPAISKEM